MADQKKQEVLTKKSLELLEQQKQELMAAYNVWQQNFLDNFLNDDYFNGDLIKHLHPIRRYSHHYDGSESGFTTDSVSEFNQAVMLACFCASRYKKETDKITKDADKNNILYQKDIDCLMEVSSQQNAVKRILKFLEGQAPILHLLDRSLTNELQQQGITIQDVNGTWGEKFSILNKALLGYQAVLKNMQLNSRYSVGCLEYPLTKKPTQTPSVESMLVIQLAVYLDGIKNNETPWLTYNQGFNIDIPSKLVKMDSDDLTFLAYLVEHSLGVDFSPDTIPDILRKRIRAGMKLCPWPDLKFHP